MKKLTETQRDNFAHWFIVLSMTSILLSILFISLKHSNDENEQEQQRRSEMWSTIGDDETEQN